MAVSLALDGCSDSIQTSRSSMVCSIIAQVWILGITPFPHNCHSSNSCADTFQMFPHWPLRWVLGNTSDNFLNLPVYLGCDRDYMWVRNLHSSMGLMVAAYQYSVSRVFHQPYTCCLAPTSGVQYSNLSEHAWLAQTYLKECPSFFVFTCLSQARLAFSSWKKWWFSVMLGTCVGGALMNAENNIVYVSFSRCQQFMVICCQRNGIFSIPSVW